jgi:UDP-2,3-diacylglucosamine pyrophosphatase LpxH
MKTAIISDTHFGDSKSRLTKNDKFDSSGSYSKLRSEILNYTGNKPVEYFILNGDIMDFSINSFHESIEIARPFFQQLKKDNLAKHIVYIPGNHDKQIWDAVQWDTNVIGNLTKYKDPTPFRCIQPGIIDLSAKKDLFLPDVTQDKEEKYGDFFLKGLFKSKNDFIPISVVYPNLYLKRSSDTIIITHGHMMEPAWVLSSELLIGVANIPNKIKLKDLEEWNVPLTSMICTGIGQAGPVSQLLYQIALESYQKNTKTLKQVLDKVLPRVDELIKLKWYLEGFDNLALEALRKEALSVASEVEETRGDKNFLKNDESIKRFLTFFNATVEEMKKLKLNRPTKILFGHSHIPINAESPYDLNPIIPDLDFYNTGGWLTGKAELFFIDDNDINSTSI